MVKMGLMPSTPNAEELPPNTEELPPIMNLDEDNIIGALAAIPMNNNDNESAPENLQSPEDLTVSSNNVMGLWSHSGICHERA